MHMPQQLAAAAAAAEMGSRIEIQQQY